MVSKTASRARRGGIHYMYDGPLGRPEESGRDGKGGTVSIISALLFIPSGSAAAVRKVLTDCKMARLANEKVRFRWGVNERGRQPVIEEYSPQAYLVYQANKVGMSIGETSEARQARNEEGRGDGPPIGLGGGPVGAVHADGKKALGGRFRKHQRTETLEARPHHPEL